MDRRELPLLLASNKAAGHSETHPLDRIRMQKGIFLLVQRGSPAWRSFYDYRPYDWGPYSRQLTADIDTLTYVDQDLAVRTTESRYGRYATTEQGEARAGRLWAEIPAQEQHFITSVRAYVTGKSFAQLLREVYAAYPDYASASRFSG